MTDENPMRIDASPTKQFFIEVLVRDIKLFDAVKDLIDNCVDGARRLRPDNNFKGLSVQVSFDKTHFRIVDNCGGITAKDAREYVFRFGRPDDVPMTHGSIGRFGVGMKRAFFKIGSNFEVTSTAPCSSFRLSVNVEDWKRLRDEKGHDLWEFRFDKLQEQQNNDASETGTDLQVTRLHNRISDEFSDKTFANALIASLEEVHSQSMESGLEIIVNTHNVGFRLAELLQSNELKPLKIEKVFPKNPGGAPDKSDVKVTLYAGIGDSRPIDAGWYVVCNGRQILRADKTRVTGWDTESEDFSIPRAHNQFTRFRGFVIFESEDAEALPWNTVKSGLDIESPVYRWAQQEMALAMRPVIDFLNMLDKEKETENTELHTMVAKAKPVNLSAVQPSPVFYSKSTYPGTPKEVLKRIAYKRRAEEVDFAKEFFEVSSAQAVGESTFDYFLQRERV